MSKTKSIADHNTRLLNLFALCHGACFALPVLLPYYSNQIGLGFSHLMAGEALFAAIIICSEVPTGWLADHWKRKYCLALAGMMGFIGFGLLSTADNFSQTLLAQGLMGLGISLVSGTQSALHYDSLLAEGRVDEYRRQEGKRHGLALLSIGGSSIAGGFLYTLNPELPLLMTMMVSGMMMFVMAMLMIEPERHKSADHGNPFRMMAKTMKYALHGHREIAEIIFISAALFSTTKMMMWAQQPYYTAIGLETQWFGVLMACGFIAGSLASNLGHLFDQHFKNRTVLMVMLGLEALLLTGSALLHNLGGAILLLAGSLFWGMGWPRVQDALNKRADSHHRATVLSTAGMMIHIMFIPLSLILGWVSDHYKIESAILCLTVLPTCAMLMLARILLREGRERERTAF